jgi:hypothetical protein
MKRIRAPLKQVLYPYSILFGWPCNLLVGIDFEPRTSGGLGPTWQESSVWQEGGLLVRPLCRAVVMSHALWSIGDKWGVVYDFRMVVLRCWAQTPLQGSGNPGVIVLGGEVVPLALGPAPPVDGFCFSTRVKALLKKYLRKLLSWFLQWSNEKLLISLWIPSSVSKRLPVTWGWKGSIWKSEPESASEPFGQRCQLATKLNWPIKCVIIAKNITGTKGGRGNALNICFNQYLL